MCEVMFVVLRKLCSRPKPFIGDHGTDCEGPHHTRGQTQRNCSHHRRTVCGCLLAVASSVLDCCLDHSDAKPKPAAGQIDRLCGLVSDLAHDCPRHLRPRPLFLAGRLIPYKWCPTCRKSIEVPCAPYRPKPYANRAASSRSSQHSFDPTARPSDERVGHG